MTGPMMPPSKPFTPRGKVKNPAQVAYMAAVEAQLLGDLQYPQARDGSIVEVSYMSAPIAYHLVRAGWRKPNNTDGFALREEFDDPVIKKRKVLGGGVYEDACVWVGANEPNDPLEHLADMSMRQIEALPDEVKYEAKRLLGLLPIPEPTPPPEMSNASGWQVQPRINITDAEEDFGDNSNSREGK